jgi:hypothetical protein
MKVIEQRNKPNSGYFSATSGFYISLLCLGFLFLAPQPVIAQQDSLVMKNGDILVGEIKDMNRGVLIFKTKYSDKDFNIEWEGIREAYGRSRFLLMLQDGRRINGRFYSDKASNRLVIIDQEGLADYVSLDELVFIKELKTSFWGRASALIDVGFNMAKANALKQYTANIKLGFLADAWQFDAVYNHLYAQQLNIDPNRRVEGSLSFRYFLQHDWFATVSINFLSNTEQALKLRSSGTAGIGKFLRRSNHAYWAVASGLSFNNETFFNTNPPQKSLEVYAGSELNLFDIGDLNLYCKPVVYYSLTNAGRWRFDFNTNLKYDLPRDFYVKTSLTLNYDNRPAETGNETDYVWAVSFGWEL